MAAVAAAIGTEHAGPKRRTYAERLALLATVPAPLTIAAIPRHLGSGGVAMVRRCGGMAVVRQSIKGGEESRQGRNTGFPREDPVARSGRRTRERR